MPLIGPGLRVPVGSVTEIRTGITLRGRDATRPDLRGSCRLIRIGDISNDGVLLTNDLMPFEPREAVKDDQFVKPGDVLFPNRGTRTTALAFDLPEPRVLAGAQFFVLKPNRNKVLPAYLAWFLRSEPAVQHFQTRRKGSHVQTIQRHDIAELIVPLPSLAIQAKIAAAESLVVQEKLLSERISQLKAVYRQRCLLSAASHSRYSVT